jgi:hypothetical protein
MTFLKTITQRLFGRTVIDSLDLNQNAWYIDEEQVTMSAAQINSIATLNAPPAATVDVANDKITYLDASNSDLTSWSSFVEYATALAGKGLAAAGGILGISFNSLDAGTIDVATDSYAFLDATDSVTKKASVSSIIAAAAPNTFGITSLNGVLQDADYGNPAVGNAAFNGIANCISVDVGPVSYVVSATPDVTQGQWAPGVTALASATNLAAAVNGDTRNNGGPYYGAWVKTNATSCYH